MRDKLYIDSEGVIHGPNCPSTKTAWGEKGAGLCPPRAVQEKMASNGPAQVATKSYRDGWDRIFLNAPGGDA